MMDAFDVGGRFDKYIDGHRSNPRLWRGALRDSLTRLNQTVPVDILDIGGGTGALEEVVGDHVRYWLLDKSWERVASKEGSRRVHGESERLPFADASFDLVISISTLQYVDQHAFFSECARVLRPGGILAIHENGANNPVIKLGRVFRRRSAEHSPAVRRYLTTISGYYEPDRNCCAGFRCIFRNEYFLFSPASFVLELKGFSRSARMVELVTVPLDQFLLRFAMAKRWAWWNVQHFEKLR